MSTDIKPNRDKEINLNYDVLDNLRTAILIFDADFNYVYTKKRRSFDTKNFIASNLKMSKTIGKFNLTNIDLALKKTYDSF